MKSKTLKVKKILKVLNCIENILNEKKIKFKLHKYDEIPTIEIEAKDLIKLSDEMLDISK